MKRKVMMMNIIYDGIAESKICEKVKSFKYDNFSGDLRVQVPLGSNPATCYPQSETFC